MKKSSGDYEVGYGKPPRANRFRPGQSGNPKGRAKRNRSFVDTLTERLAQLVRVDEGGVTRRITVQELLARKLIKNAAEGDFRSLNLILQHVQPDDPHRGKAGQGSRDRDRQVLEEFARMQGVSLSGLIEMEGGPAHDLD